MAKYRYYLVSLTPEEIVDRLRKRIGWENILGFCDSDRRMVVGHVKPATFRLRVPRGLQANSFAPYLYGRIWHHRRGALVRTRISMHPMATGFFISAFTTLIGASLWGFAGKSLGFGAPPASAFGFAGMAVIFWAATWIWRKIDCSHEVTLTGFIETMLGDKILKAP